MLFSVRKDGNLNAYICYFPSVRTEIKCNNSLFSVRTDGNLQVNFAIFRPYGRKLSVIIRYFLSAKILFL